MIRDRTCIYDFLKDVLMERREYIDLHRTKMQALDVWVGLTQLIQLTGKNSEQTVGFAIDHSKWFGRMMEADTKSKMKEYLDELEHLVRRAKQLSGGE